MSTDGSRLGFAELLRLAASKGLQELDVQVAQVPGETNGGHAVVLAAARTSGGLYRAVGEAWRDELPAAQRFVVLTVAERRAKVRALCEAVGMPQALNDGVDVPAEAPAPADEPTQIRAGHEVRSVSEARPAWAQRGSAAAPERPASSGEDDMGTPPAEAPALRADTAVPAPAGRDLSGAQRPTPASQAPGAPARARAEVPPAEVPPAERARPEVQSEAPRHVSQPRAAEPLGPDIFQQLMRMMHQKATLDGEEITDEEAHARLDSFFQRAFSHSMEEATRVEGKQTIQRLASAIARLKQERGGAPASAAG